MRLIATRQIYSSERGQVLAGQEFDWPENEVQNLLASGAARLPYPPKIRYETKPTRFEAPLVTPEAPEVSARQPFRGMCLPNEEQTRVVAEGNSVLAGPDISKQGTADPRGRRRR